MTLDFRLQLPRCLVPVSSRQKSLLSGACEKSKKDLVFENILVLTFFLRIGEEGATVENQVLFLTIKID